MKTVMHCQTANHFLYENGNPQTTCKDGNLSDKAFAPFYEMNVSFSLAHNFKNISHIVKDLRMSLDHKHHFIKF